MDVQDLKPRKGDDTYRIGDSDELVVMENIGTVPSSAICLQNHGIIVFCTEGRAQFEYDGNVVQIQKNDLFLYMVHSTASNILSSSDFNCRQIWFTRSELWNIEIYNMISVADMSQLKLHPIVHLSDEDIKLCDTYVQLLCSRLKSSIIDNFIRLVEESDGRIRRVDEFARQLNITPKYLSTVLKEVMNRRPSTYIQLYTLKAIEYRLRFTDMTMQEISHDLKFPNPSFFGKYCKEHLGVTPLEYRMKYQKGKPVG